MTAAKTITAKLARLICASAMLLVMAVGRGAAGGEAASPPSTVLDRLWIWTHPAGAHDGIDLGGGRKGKSRIKPVEGADCLGVPNLYFIHFPNNPPISEFRRYARDFRPMKRVVWSLTGAGGDTSPEGREAVLRLATEFPNISGFVLDDFLHWSADAPPDPWLAANDVRFPVSLVLAPPAPAAVHRMALVQTSWRSGDYRSKEVAIDLSEDGRGWKEVHRGILPNTAAARVEVKLPGTKVAALRVRILSTHDTQAAISCGLGEVQLWEGNRRIPLDHWKASASSTYSERFLAENVLTPGRPKPEESGKAAGNPVAASMTPEQLNALRERIAAQGRTLPISCVVYTHQVSPRILPHVNQVDKVAMWTWRSEDLVNLKANFERLRRIVHPKPILLGCYLFDYGDNKQMTVQRMQRQCELGLKWLHEGKIEGMIFLASNVCDMNLPAVEWTRKWSTSVGKQPVERIGVK